MECELCFYSRKNGIRAHQRIALEDKSSEGVSPSIHVEFCFPRVPHPEGRIPFASLMYFGCAVWTGKAISHAHSKNTFCQIESLKRMRRPLERRSDAYRRFVSHGSNAYCHDNIVRYS